MTKNRKKLWFAGAALVFAGAAFGAWVTTATGRFPFSYSHIPVLASSSGDVGDITLQSGFGPVVEKVLPAVVSITSTRTVRTGDQGANDPLEDDFFRRFFGDEYFRQFDLPRQQRLRGLGSGVITTADGYILTNNHVIDNTDEVKVTTQDKREFTARVVGSDPQADLAVLKIDASKLPLIQIGDSDGVKVGDVVLAVGNPFGVGQTVTMGIVSATGRRGLGIEDYEDFIQTDAAMNPGNSGGALVNVKGELIGINTAILSNGGGGNQGVGFAIPVKMARNAMDQIIQQGKVTRGWLGVAIQPVTPEIARSFSLPGNPRGALVGDVSPGSPAEKGGLKRGDIVLELNGAKVDDSRDLRLRIGNLKPGSSAQFKVFRDGVERDLTAVLGEAPVQPETAVSTGGGSEALPKLGIQVEPLSSQTARRFGLPAAAKGIVVTSVAPGSAAEEAGLQPGDIIKEVNRQNVTDLPQFQRSLGGAKGTVLLLIDRKGQHQYVTVRLQ
jgi:serine protease Do